MIKAHEARELVKQSDATIERLIKKIDPLVRAQAELGKTELAIWDGELTIHSQHYPDSTKATPVMKKMVEKLKLFGYAADIVTEKEKVGRGLGGMRDDDEIDRLPDTFKCFIRIRW